MASNDESDTIQTVAWLCAGLSTFAVVGRSVIKANLIRRIGADDVFIVAGLLCFIGQCGALQFQTYSGLGKHVTDSSTQELEQEMKAEYANNLLYMPILAFSKLSVVSLLRKFALVKRDRLVLYMFEWFLAGWAISSEFVFAFNCLLPAPWDYKNNVCVNREAWVIYFEAVNMVSDLALIIMPTLVVMRLHTSWARRIMATFFFFARVFCIPASVARTIYFIYESPTEDATWNTLPFTVASIIVATLEILAACVLYLRPLFDVLESGFALTYDPTHRDPRHAPDYGPYSVGTWPFTSIKPLDAYLTGRGVEYRAAAYAQPSDEKTGTGSDEGRIHISQQVDVHRSSPPPPPQAPSPAQRLYLDRTKIPSMHTESMARPPSLDKSLPPTPEIQKGTYLLP